MLIWNCAEGHGCWGQYEHIDLYCQIGQCRAVAMLCDKQCTCILSCPWHCTSTYTHTFGIIHFLCTHHEHQTSTYVNHYEQTHCMYYWHCKALCLIALSAANIVQYWWQLNEIWLWSCWNDTDMGKLMQSLLIKNAHIQVPELHDSYWNYYGFATITDVFKWHIILSDQYHWSLPVTVRIAWNLAPPQVHTHIICVHPYLSFTLSGTLSVSAGHKC
jgi:hypothetical protein